MQFFAVNCSAAPASPSAPVRAPASGQSASPEAAAGAAKTEGSNADLKPVLDPNNYFGKAKAGYAAAKKCPEICAKLFCYCGCDNTDEHSSLLDCFTSDHGVDCYICQEEALIALKMKEQGKSLAEIQKVIDLAYKKEYPWDTPSEAFKKYKAAKLWKDPGKLLDKTGSQDSASSTTGKNGATTGNAKGSRTLPDKDAAKRSTKGACCGGQAKSH